MIVGHVLGIPVEESVVQLLPTVAAIVTALAIARRSGLDALRRRRRRRPRRDL